MPNTVANVPQALHVVAAVIRGHGEQQGKVFLAKRPAHISQGGKWEFPGGKVEAGETREAALARELQEEIGITVLTARPLIEVCHRYVERLVHLDVWEVTHFSGEPHGKEGQETAWFDETAMAHLTFPAANLPIIMAAQLPDTCLITPEPQDTTAFLQQLARVLQTGVRLVQFRAKSLTAEAYTTLARQVISLAHEAGAKVLLNAPPVWLAEADGLHLTSAQLMAFSARADELAEKWLSAACHNAQELQQASAVGVDFAFLSPVLPTLSHPDASTLGWDNFAEMVASVNLPVFALGGLSPSTIEIARAHGGQGIAAIHGLWSN